MDSKERNQIRKNQDLLLRDLRNRAYFRQRWNDPLSPGAPSPADLERFLFPAFDAKSYLKRWEE